MLGDSIYDDRHLENSSEPLNEVNHLKNKHQLEIDQKKKLKQKIFLIIVSILILLIISMLAILALFHSIKNGQQNQMTTTKLTMTNKTKLHLPHISAKSTSKSLSYFKSSASASTQKEINSSFLELPTLKTISHNVSKTSSIQSMFFKIEYPNETVISKSTNNENKLMLLSLSNLNNENISLLSNYTSTFHVNSTITSEMMNSNTFLETKNETYLPFQSTTVNRTTTTARPVDFQNEMIKFVSYLAIEMKELKKDFIIVVDLSLDSNTVNQCSNFTNLIDGILMAYSLNSNEEQLTMEQESDLENLMFVTEKCNKKVLISARESVIDSFKQSLSFAAFRSFSRLSNQIPNRINDETNLDIYDFNKTQNFLIYSSTNYQKLEKTNYDLLIIDPFKYKTNQIIDPKSLKIKNNKKKRFVLGSINIDTSNTNSYNFNETLAYFDVRNLEAKFKNYYYANYWMHGWQRIIRERTQRVLNAGFDGILIKGFSTYQCFKNKQCHVIK